MSNSVANATSDLLMLGAWSSALEHIQGENIPVILQIVQISPR